MKTAIRLRAIFVAGVALVWVPMVKAQFFLGPTVPTFGTTSGTITNTPVSVGNNATYEINVNGQFDVTNPAAGLQTSDFRIFNQLDPTFNGGTPISIQMQINQSGFVDGPALGIINGWTIVAQLVDNTGVLMNQLIVSSPSPTYNLIGSPITYGPTTTFGSSFIYNPAIASDMILTFVSPFNSTGAGVYTWDFPLTLKFSVVPEPSSIGLFAAGALALLGLGRRLKKRLSQ